MSDEPSAEMRTAEERADMYACAIDFSTGPVRMVSASTAIRIAEEHAEAAVAEMRRERDALQEKLDLAEAFDRARLSQIKHEQFATFAAQENYANAIKERDAARAEADELRALLGMVHRYGAALDDDCSDDHEDAVVPRGWFWRRDAALAQEPK